MIQTKILNAHTQSPEEVLKSLDGSLSGLTQKEAQKRLAQFGANQLPQEPPPSKIKIFIRQFKSPLIYILFTAMAVAFLIEAFSDAIFIGMVLCVNALIGTYQEYVAERSALALKKYLPQYAHVLRDHESFEIPAENLVPGDIVLLEAGAKVPADLRLIQAESLEVDESLLSGESVPVFKNSNVCLAPETAYSDQRNMAFSGSFVVRGKGTGVVVATGAYGFLGQIAKPHALTKAPLIIRMEKFSRLLAMMMGGVVIFMMVMGFIQHISMIEMFYTAVALAVAAIPEALPVALTIVLAIGMKRMVKKHVIVRKLVAIESLGSCTYVAADKTGTLTVNELTVKKIVLPSNKHFQVAGEGIEVSGEVKALESCTGFESKTLHRLGLCALITNDGYLAKREDDWTAHGDPVDISLLVLAHKLKLNPSEEKLKHSELAVLPYSSEHALSASLCLEDNEPLLFVKGAPERILSLCTSMYGTKGLEELNLDSLNQQVERLAKEGYKVIAFASAPWMYENRESISLNQLKNMNLLGFVGIIDPLRKEAKDAVKACKEAGLKVAMITGDHPVTASAIAKELSILKTKEEVVTGLELYRAAEEGEKALDAMIQNAYVYARVDPKQKMIIVDTLNRLGHFVAVTGDGVNDVPALKAAHVGVAMGKRGTEIAKESASIILTDDHFESLVNGIEEGRLAYSNIRKVIYFTISTGVAEVLLFIMTILTGLPLPLLPVQLLWLNLVTNGIQDVALAFEETEGDELKKRPRSPKEPLFEKLMLSRVFVSSVTMAILAYGAFYFSLKAHLSVEEARNLTLLLMVLFENFQAFNSRSETQSLLKRGLFRNPLLWIGVLVVQMIHIGAMYTPWLKDVLRIQPVSLSTWAYLVLGASLIVIVVEIQKLFQTVKSPLVDK